MSHKDQKSYGNLLQQNQKENEKLVGFQPDMHTLTLNCLKNSFFDQTSISLGHGFTCYVAVIYNCPEQLSQFATHIVWKNIFRVFLLEKFYLNNISVITIYRPQNAIKVISEVTLRSCDSMDRQCHIKIKSLMEIFFNKTRKKMKSLLVFSQIFILLGLANNMIVSKHKVKSNVI